MTDLRATLITLVEAYTAYADGRISKEEFARAANEAINAAPDVPTAQQGSEPADGLLTTDWSRLMRLWGASSPTRS